MMVEFLPLCDLLFNVISLAGYFCDIVFDLIMCYALLDRGYKATFAAAISFILLSLLISQVLSLKWYLKYGTEKNAQAAEVSRSTSTEKTLIIILHVFQLGVLWRYAKLFIPVDLSYVKQQVRNLCILRLVHAFCEAAPMLLLQLNVVLGYGSTDTPRNKALWELAVVSSWLSLFSVCWALASFSKNVRRHNLHRLVLTWLGVIFQLLWRLGTVSARIAALSAYALIYKQWLLLVLGLHWFSMFLWLVSPRGAAGQVRLAALVSIVYVFAYINVNNVHHKHKMVTFYSVMCIENMLLGVAWACGTRLPGDKAAGLAAAFCGAFFIGLANMLLYYRYFHVKRLNYDGEGKGAVDDNDKTKKCKINGIDNTAIPGVFNCRFANPVASNIGRRKKKKPSHFVPPPGPPPPAFWRRPQQPHSHHGGSSENEGSSVGSRVNIQQKLQEKKQKQLAELRVIEEEIKQGKLSCASGRVSADEIYSSLQRQPIPTTKNHATEALYQNLPAYLVRMQYQDERSGHCGMDCADLSALCYTSQSPQTVGLDATNALSTLGTNLLHHTPNNSAERNRCTSRVSPVECDARVAASKCHITEIPAVRRVGNPLPIVHEELEERRRRAELLLTPHYLPLSQRIQSHPDSTDSGSERSAHHHASDLDSQISLPRSYTLPREFRFLRKKKEQHHSNNSSDGDVDSADEVEGGISGAQLRAHLQARLHARRQQQPHETKL